MQLPFAIVPLVMFTADRRKMGELVSPRWVTALAVIVAVVVIALNIKVLSDLVSASGSYSAGAACGAAFFASASRWCSRAM